MAYGRDAGTSRGSAGHEAKATRREALSAALAADPGLRWAEEEEPPRDWKKLALVVGLGILSWVATYVGMLELIEANMGDLPLLHKVIIGFSVAMLMTMIIWLLDQMFAPIPTFTKLVYIVGYVFLTLISVGFGFGFYWKVLESRSESSRSAESAVTQVQSSLHAAATRLDQLSTTLVQLTQVSTSQAEIEKSRGLSCPNSRPGDGPRRKLRDDDAGRFNFASEFVKGRAGQVKADLGALDGDLAKIAVNDPSLIDAKSGTRNEFMKSLGRKLDLTVTGFNAFRTDPQLRQIRSDLAERAEKTTFPDTKGGTFACPDPQLQSALRGVVRAIDHLPDLEKPRIAAVEGSEATIEAFRRLTATFYGALSFKLPPSADELRDLQKKAVQSVETPASAQRAMLTEAAGLSKRDYIPLAIAAFVDFCLLLVSMGRPANRLGGLVGKMRAAERGPVIQILSRFNDIHRDPSIRQNFEVFRHVVFDVHGAYYVAVPLDAPYRFKKAHGSHGIGTAQLEELQQEAHLLANLFASFEKEKIFSRVYSPLLSTRAIQRKLWRQGSKFAGCEAFRVYRFRDGAWSELILGAVMGAARRVELAKRQGLIGDESVRELGAAANRSWTVEPSARPIHEARRSTAETGRAQSAAGHAGTLPFGDEMALRSSAMAPGPVARAEVDRWGPYAPYAKGPQVLPQHPAGPEGPLAESLRGAANSNTAPAEAPDAAADRTRGHQVELPPNVTPLPHVAVRPQGPLPPAERVPLSDASPAASSARPDRSDDDRIVLSRTETISIPATAASLPISLARAGLSEALVGPAATDATVVDAGLRARPPLAGGAAIGQREGEHGATRQIAVVGPDDYKTLRRFAPGAAE